MKGASVYSNKVESIDCRYPYAQTYSHDMTVIASPPKFS